MEFFYNLLDNTNIPILSAFILGLMTAISPCPLATNITATAYISKDLSNKQKIFYNGIYYTLGRIISYSLIGVILFFGASAFEIGTFFSTYGELLLGPLLLVIGVFMLDLIKIRFPWGERMSFTDRIASKAKGGSAWSALILGIVFALAFCPYSGVLYFGMLIPMTLGNAQGLILPPVFALATGLPVIVIAWLLAFSISGIGEFYNKIRTFEYWFRRIAAVVFIITGIYYVIIIHF
ncbi:MAG: sulfite exporter TauE/SafE family protein [Bacteroidetes bacterium]|nr:MAG: sulfite exporter TauE/SafE family protein [Bacteroidota bacterium]